MERKAKSPQTRQCKADGVSFDTIPPTVDLAAVVRLAAAMATLKTERFYVENPMDDFDRHRARQKAFELINTTELSPATREWLNTFITEDTDNDER